MTRGHFLGSEEVAEGLEGGTNGRCHQGKRMEEGVLATQVGLRSLAN